jgi:hypothetical protein
MLSIDMLSIRAELVDRLLPKCRRLLPEAELILCMGGEDTQRRVAGAPVVEETGEGAVGAD